MLSVLLWCGVAGWTFAQNEVTTTPVHWGDSLMRYAMTQYLPSHRFRWDWGEATFLKAVILRSQLGKDRETMNRYVTEAVNCVVDRAHGNHPNAVAPAVGVAFLLSQDSPNRAALAATAKRIYDEYLMIPRAFNGGVSHRDSVVELWDDTVYMISLFLLEMYRLSGEEAYVVELIKQMVAHTEVLWNENDGLFYHGWDADSISTDDRCCMLGWADNPLRRNGEYWGRGNGWIAAAMADVLAAVPENFAGRERIRDVYCRMMRALLPLQDAETGHWFQLPLYPGEVGNFIESSSTAMFGYAMCVGIKEGVLPRDVFLPAVSRAFEGLAKYSVVRTEDGGYTLWNVCSGTCIGDRAYYYNRRVTRGSSFGLGMAVMFYDRFVSLNE
jgi:unsaturated rhamnogalacturonyl hydrolase